MKVSPEYQAFAEENDIESYIDFYWMKNAFIADYLADVLISNGYTRGSLSSFDGFIRNLDGSGTQYSFNIYNRFEGSVYPAAVMQYTGPSSIVYLRDYIMNDLDSQYYYRLENGEVRTSYLDVQDGRCKSSRSDLVCTSQNSGCAEVLLQMAPLYIADSFQKEKVAELANNGIYSVYCENGEVLYNDDSVTFSSLYDGDGVRYQAKRIP